MTRRACAVAAVLALALGGAGCAQRQSDAEYERRLATAVLVRSTTATDVRSGAISTRAQFADAARDVDRARRALDRDLPPRGLEDAHASMSAGLDAMADVLRRRARCAGIEATDAAAGKACRSAIGQDEYDELRNEFVESDTIYRESGLSLPGMIGGGGEAGADAEGAALDLGDTGGDEL